MDDISTKARLEALEFTSAIGLQHFMYWWQASAWTSADILPLLKARAAAGGVQMLEGKALAALVKIVETASTLRRPGAPEPDAS